jgi:hypothetical protein
MFEDQKPIPRMALKIGIAGFIGFGALATGMFVTRKGRHLVREAWQGRERTRIEDRVLDALWDDVRLSRRRLDVDEVEPGHIEISGIVRSDRERRLALRIARQVNGVTAIGDAMTIVPRPPKKRLGLRSAAERRAGRGIHATHSTDLDDAIDEDDTSDDEGPSRGGPAG